MSESSTNTLEALSGFVKAHIREINTSMPGVIVNYANGIASVKPSVKKIYEDGESLDYPILQIGRVCWPSFAGGNAGVKGPIKAGDPCYIVFSQQPTDNTNDGRMFSLSDAYIIMCNTGKVVSESANNSDMIMYYGSASIKISNSGEIEINAPGGLKINGNTVADGSMDVQEQFIYRNGMQGFGGATSNGKTMDETHRHSGVQTGNGITGEVV